MKKIAHRKINELREIGNCCTFIESNLANIPFWNLRTVAGVIFLLGFLVFVYNVIMTAKQAGRLAREAA
ncbi:MAG: hypothetical protein BWK76_28475 [Desulfobulbaceae bacterium A2]|nr:MAG: hypothetical protein BWK76_28475 [Desulfobulbaceae bacterium A2]